MNESTPTDTAQEPRAKRTVLSVCLPPDVLTRGRRYAAKEDRSFSWVVSTALSQYLDRCEPKPRCRPSINLV